MNNFQGKFDVGVAIHACGSSTDLIIEKCIKSQADILIAPCCYGSIKPVDYLSYPRSIVFNKFLSKENYQRLTHVADSTERGLACETSAYECMQMIDTDRLLYLKEHKYAHLQLSKLLPETCTTKNSLILTLFNS